MAEYFKSIANAVKGFGYTDIIDIGILAIILFFIFRLIKKRNAKGIFIYLVLGLIVYFAVSICREYVPLLHAIISGAIVPMLIFIVVALFAPEIKGDILRLSRRRRNAEYYSAKYDVNDEVLRNTIAEIIRSVQNMSKKNIGALIVISPAHIQPQILDSGTAMNAVVSAALIESVFNTKAPMHDGAVIIRANQILAAGCFLPLSQNAGLPHDLGTRHRAALGVSEGNDVLTIIVSEQTGIISICRNGVISRYFDSNMLNDALEQVYGLAAAARKRKRKLS